MIIKSTMMLNPYLFSIKCRLKVQSTYCMGGAFMKRVMKVNMFIELLMFYKTILLYTDLSITPMMASFVSFCK